MDDDDTPSFFIDNSVGSNVGKFGSGVDEGVDVGAVLLAEADTLCNLVLTVEIGYKIQNLIISVSDPANELAITNSASETRA